MTKNFPVEKTVRRVRNMQVGENGFVQPAYLKVLPSFKAYIFGGAEFFPAPSVHTQLEIIRMPDGYVADIRLCDKKYVWDITYPAEDSMNALSQFKAVAPMLNFQLNLKSVFYKNHIPIINVVTDSLEDSGALLHMMVRQ